MGCSCSKDAASGPQPVANKPIDILDSNITGRPVEDLKPAASADVRTGNPDLIKASEKAKTVESAGIAAVLGNETAAAAPSESVAGAASSPPPPGRTDSNNTPSAAPPGVSSVPSQSIELVQRSWQQFSGDANAGMALLTELFERVPDSKAYFGLEAMSNDDESPELKAHADAAIEVVGRAVMDLSDPDRFQHTLQEIGYGALDEQHKVFNSVILATMEKTLGAAWTIDTKNAWVESLEMASTAMMHSQFEREAPITPVYLQPEPLPVEQQDWVRLTWQTIARDLKGNGIVLMKELFTIEPAAAAYFGLPDSPDLYSSPEVQSYAESTMKTIGSVIGKIGNPDKLDPVLSMLGGFHGNSETTYTVFGQALLGMLEKSLGTQWTPEVKGAWEETYKTAAAGMIEYGARPPSPSSVIAPDVMDADPEPEREPEHTPCYVKPQSLPMMEEDNVRLTWQIAARDRSFAGNMMKGLLTADESIGAMASLNMDDPTVTSSPEARSLALLIAKYIGSSVAKFQDPTKLEPLVQELGTLAAKHKVSDAHYDAFSTALMTTLGDTIGPHWTPEVKDAWTSACAKVLDGVKAACA